MREPPVLSPLIHKKDTHDEQTKYPTLEQATTNVYRIGKDGKIIVMITGLINPNGLAFSPDENKLYVVEWKGAPNRSIWSLAGPNAIACACI